MINNRFEYFIDRINSATLLEYPFEHIEIDNLFKDKDFNEIISSPEIAIPVQLSDSNLLDYLFNNEFKCIDFPGCVTSKREYLKWHKNKSKPHNYKNTSCEGFGMTFRLKKAKTKIIEELMNLLSSSEFQKVLSNKFKIDLNKVYYDQGIQKYLDGYEISPHPDLRSKALTFMVNINPSNNSESTEHHTHYLKFKRQYKYVQTFWEENKNKDRCWVPWNWCETVKKQTKNNSIVIFSPNDKTLHAVKADYDHLPYQRTQLYGNLWYNKEESKIKSIISKPIWEEFVVNDINKERDWPVRNKILSAIPSALKNIAKKIFNKLNI